MREYFFFFSSRRRHTRYWRDWSSDVCSSDLLAIVVVHVDSQIAQVLQVVERIGQVPELVFEEARTERSEERRVGKECRCRWSWEQSKKKDNWRANLGGGS